MNLSSMQKAGPKEHPCFVAEMGTHEKLLKDGGLDADLWKVQEKAANWQLQ